MLNYQIPMMKFKPALLALVLSASAYAQRAPEVLQIDPAVKVNAPTSPGTFYELQSSPDLENWIPERTFAGTGNLVESVFVTETNRFFRLAGISYPQLNGVQVTTGGTGLNPAFDPGIYTYALRVTGEITVLTFDFGTDVTEADLNGEAVGAGQPVSLVLTNHPDLWLRLEGQNGLVTKYLIKPIPAAFPYATVTNLVSPDNDYVILNAARFQNNAPGSWLMVLDNRGVPLWWKRIELGLHLQVHGNGLLSYVAEAGRNANNDRLSQNVVMDSYFNELFSLMPEGEYINDLHAFLITTRGTYYSLEYQWNTNTLEIDGVLTNLYVKDNFIKEQSLATGEVLFEWGSWGNISYLDSKYPNQADYAHLNWVAEDFDGNPMVSARGTSQVIKIDKRTGNVQWRLGGAMSDFEFVDDPLNGFGGQHSAHRLPNGNILIFDNRNFVSTNKVLPGEGPSRVVEYQLDETAGTAKLVWSYTREGYHSTSEGGAQRLPNGNTFITWGKNTATAMTEVDSAGTILQDIRITDSNGINLLAYHSYKVKREEIAGIRDQPRPGPQPVP